ncbi:hypothetical protein R1flu_009980 [Riccia fluitans]|uniref:Uncharacterized protein n=1 Tax=Riccia fluitans TaxID=41844 RepID=A0ABD1Z4K1_9MARC
MGVFFWDLRIQSGSLAGCPKHMPVTKIKDAHKGVLNAKRRKGYTRSVTSVMYVKDERLVATAGANDGVHECMESPASHRILLEHASLRPLLIATKGEPKTFTGHTMGSFYIKASFSPDGTHILGGSTDHNAYLWKVDRPEDPPVLLRSHSGEVTAVDWYVFRKLVSFEFPVLTVASAFL